MQYKDAVAYINDIPRFASKNTLDTTAYFLASLGNPQEKYKVIHIAGTNGKGSTCAYLNSMILSMNHSVGMFTSPHLIEMTERIRINDVDITKEHFLDIFNLVHKKAKELEEKGLPHPSFFEFVMIMAFVAFEQCQVEYVVLETGIGGRYDSTNVVNNPIATIITSIGLDHEEYLGNSLEEIAYQKAGIIKKNAPVIYDDELEKVNCVIEKIAFANDTKCRKISDSAYEIIDNQSKYIAFYMQDRYDKDIRWEIPNKGSYQVKNAILAIITMEQLFGNELMEQRVKALKDVYWPGRMEEVLPNIYVDGAHNIPGVSTLVNEITKIDILVFATLEDKSFREIIKKITSSMSIKQVIVTKVDNQRAVDPQELNKLFEECGQTNILVIENVDKLMTHLMKKSKREKVLCVGSLYLVGEIKNYIHCNKGVENA